MNARWRYLFPEVPSATFLIVVLILPCPFGLICHLCFTLSKTVLDDSQNTRGELGTLGKNKNQHVHMTLTYCPCEWGLLPKEIKFELFESAFKNRGIWSSKAVSHLFRYLHQIKTICKLDWHIIIKSIIIETNEATWRIFILVFRLLVLIGEGLNYRK